MLDRRTVLTGLLSACWVARGGVRAAQPAPLSPRPARLIDVHHHLFTPAMAAALSGSIPAALLPGVQRSLAEMDLGGTATAVISYPNGDITTLPAPQLAALLRSANDEAAAVVAAHRPRYGLFASLPMPHVDASLRELAYACDQLHADGLMLLTSYADHWLGDPEFAPLLEELDRRAAVVFVHPTGPGCCANLLPGLNPAVIEYETDTARTIASLIFTGAADRYPNIQWLFSHGGGTMPILIARFEAAVRSSPRIAGRFEREPAAYLRQFHYDTAWVANAVVMDALLQIVPPTQVLFGTDFPYQHAAEQSDALGALLINPETLQAVLAGNARRLLPRLPGVAAQRPQA